MGGLFIRYGIPGILVLSIITGVIIKIKNLENTIASNLVRIQELSHRLDNKRLELISRENTISSLEANNKELVDSIDLLNTNISNLNSDYEEAKRDLEHWINQPREVKYKYITKYITNQDINYTKASCVEGMELMKSIGSIKYDDL